MKAPTPLILALALLTRIPLPQSWFNRKFGKNDHAQSPLYYPLVGLVITAGLLTIALVANLIFAPLAVAVLVLLGWVAITGALHLDGLADCADAYFAAHKVSTQNTYTEKRGERALAVLKDPHAGTLAVVAIVISLLLKLCFLYELASALPHLALGICVATITARLFTVFYMISTPYVRAGGIASALQVSPHTKTLTLITIAIGTTLFFATNVLFFASVIISVCAWFYWWRQRWLTTIGGYTGDCLGGFIEGAEIIVLAVTVVWI